MYAADFDDRLAYFIASQPADASVERITPHDALVPYLGAVEVLYSPRDGLADEISGDPESPLYATYLSYDYAPGIWMRVIGVLRPTDPQLHVSRAYQRGGGVLFAERPDPEPEPTDRLLSVSLPDLAVVEKSYQDLRHLDPIRALIRNN